jgi:Uma2 family endonuclease
VVFEVRSPGDESYEKLPFYAALALEAVVIVDRDTRAVQVFELTEGAYTPAAASADGWTTITTLGVELRADTTGDARLHMRLAADAGSESLI